MRPVLVLLGLLGLPGCGGGEDAGAPDAEVPQTPITACGEILTSGAYVLTGDLAAPEFQPCLNIHDTADVFIRCAGHVVLGDPAIQIKNVHGFSLRDCTIRGRTLTLIAQLEDSDHGLIEDNIIETNYVNARGLTDTRIVNNTFHATYQQYYSARNEIAMNTFISPFGAEGTAAGLVISAFGTDNRITDNTMDGRWDGAEPPQMTGTDDAVILSDDDGALVARNDMSNVWDCGVETFGMVSNATIVDNRIRSAAYCGIGGWYWNGLRSSTISRNTVERTRQLFAFFRIYGLRPANWDGRGAPADTEVAFHDNVFEANTFADPIAPTPFAASNIPVYTQMGYSGGVSAIMGERVPTPSEYNLTGNVFRTNDFTRTVEAPRWGAPTVPGLIVDGGGNLCMPPSGGGYPIVCN